jgi:hypothetical protein
MRRLPHTAEPNALDSGMRAFYLLIACITSTLVVGGPCVAAEELGADGIKALQWLQLGGLFHLLLPRLLVTHQPTSSFISAEAPHSRHCPMAACVLHPAAVPAQVRSAILPRASLGTLSPR